MTYLLTAPHAAGYWPFVSTRVSVRPRLTVARIKEVVAAHFDLPIIEMTSARRSRQVARPRQIAMYLARELTPKSLPDIGRLFGGRDHTTVIWAIKQVESLIEADAEIANDVDLLRAKLIANDATPSPYAAQVKWSVG